MIESKKINQISKTSNLLELDLVPILLIGNKKTITVKDLINQIVEKLDKGEAYCLAVYARNLAELNKETAELALEKALEALALAKKAYDLAIQCGGGGSIDDDLYLQLLTLIHNLENKVNNNSTLILNILNSSIKASVASKTNEIIYKLYKGNTEFLSITVPQYKAGNNIDITNNVISVTNLPKYTGSEYIDITNNVISIKGLADVATSGNYSDLSNTPKQVSLFNNDAGYITEVDLGSINNRLETLEICCEEFKKKEDYNVINHIPDSLLQNSSIDTDIQLCVAEIVSEKVISITDVIMNNLSIKDNCDITLVTPFYIILNYPKIRYSGILEFITGDIYIEGTSNVLDVDYSVSIDAYVGNPRELMATITRCFSEGTAVLELDSPPGYIVNPSAYWDGVESPNKAVAFSDYKIRTITLFTLGTLEPDVRYEIEDAFIPQEIYFEMVVHDDTSNIDYPTIAHIIKNLSTTYTVRLEENQVIDIMKVKMGDEYITDLVYTYGSNVINIPSVLDNVQANFTTKTILEEEEELSRYEVSINVTKPNGCSYNYSDNANIIQGVKTVTQGDTYTALFSMSDSHYVMKSIKVKHNGTDVTSTSWNSTLGVITIQDVLGNIEITIVLDTIYYKVFKSYNSLHCTYTDSVSSTGIPYGGTYTATISAKYGYKIDSVTATINGSPVGTYLDNTLTVSNIDGDVLVNVVSSLDESIPRTVNVLLDNNLDSVATITPTTMTIGSNFTTVEITLDNLYLNLSITKVSHGSTNITNKLNISISGNVATITPKSDIVIAQDIVVYGTYEAVKYSVKLNGDIKINGSIQPISGAVIQGGVCYVNKGSNCKLRIIHPNGVNITSVTSGVLYDITLNNNDLSKAIIQFTNVTKNIEITGNTYIRISNERGKPDYWFENVPIGSESLVGVGNNIDVYFIDEDDTDSAKISQSHGSVSDSHWSVRRAWESADHSFMRFECVPNALNLSYEKLVNSKFKVSYRGTTAEIPNITHNKYLSTYNIFRHYLMYDKDSGEAAIYSSGGSKFIKLSGTNHSFSITELETNLYSSAFPTGKKSIIFAYGTAVYCDGDRVPYLNKVTKRALDSSVFVDSSALIGDVGLSLEVSSGTTHFSKTFTNSDVQSYLDKVGSIEGTWFTLDYYVYNQEYDPYKYIGYKGECINYDSNDTDYHSGDTSFQRTYGQIRFELTIKESSDSSPITIKIGPKGGTEENGALKTITITK